MEVHGASPATPQSWPKTAAAPNGGPARLAATSQSIGSIAGVPTALLVSDRGELSELVERLQTGIEVGLPGLLTSDLAAQLASTLRDQLAEQSAVAAVLHLDFSSDRLAALLG